MVETLRELDIECTVRPGGHLLAGHGVGLGAELFGLGQAAGDSQQRQRQGHQYRDRAGRDRSGTCGDPRGDLGPDPVSGGFVVAHAGTDGQNSRRPKMVMAAGSTSNVKTTAVTMPMALAKPMAELDGLSARPRLSSARTTVAELAMIAGAAWSRAIRIAW